MVIYEIIFTKRDSVLYRHRVSGSIGEEHSVDLLMGIASAFASFGSSLAPQPCRNFFTFATGQYKAHMFEGEPGYRLFILTHPEADDMRQALSEIFSKLFLPLVVLNPLYKDGSLIDVQTNCFGFGYQLRKALTSWQI